MLFKVIVVSQVTKHVLPYKQATATSRPPYVGCVDELIERVVFDLREREVLARVVLHRAEEVPCVVQHPSHRILRPRSLLQLFHAIVEVVRQLLKVAHFVLVRLRKTDSDWLFTVFVISDLYYDRRHSTPVKALSYHS